MLKLSDVYDSISVISKPYTDNNTKNNQNEYNKNTINDSTKSEVKEK